MALITIGVTALPNPYDYAVTRRDLDSENSARTTETGVLHRERIRAGVYEAKASWLVSKANLKVITDALAPASFSATIFDPTTSSDTTLTMYAGDMTAKLSKYVSEAAPADSYWDITVSLIEY